VCNRGTDGMCIWHAPYCRNICPLLSCPAIACPAAQQQTDATGCPVCGCGPPPAI
jgi:hypothetical protein